MAINKYQIRKKHKYTLPINIHIKFQKRVKKNDSCYYISLRGKQLAHEDRGTLYDQYMREF